MEKLADDLLLVVLSRVLANPDHTEDSFAWFRHTIPLVCSRWRLLLNKPSPLWESITVNAIKEGRYIGAPVGQPTPTSSPQTSPRRLRPAKLHGDQLLAWLSKRAPALRSLRIKLESANHTLNPRHFNVLCNMFKRNLLQLELHSPRCLCSRDNWETISVAKALQSLTIHDCPMDFLEVGLPALSFLPRLRHLAFSLAKDELFEVRYLALPTQLTSLHIANLQFHNTSGVMANKLPSLRNLSIHNCYITHDLAALFDFASIETLDITSSYHPPHTHLPSLPSLVSLTLSCSPLRPIPFFERAPHTLAHLDLSHNNADSLPSSLSTITSLDSLSLSACSLANFPAFLSSLSVLHSLDVSNNCLGSLPKVAPPFSSTLQQLNISSNRLSSLPSWIFTMPCLTSLIVSSHAAAATAGFDDAILCMPQLSSLHIVGNDKTGPSYHSRLVKMLLRLNTLSLSSNKSPLNLIVE